MSENMVDNVHRAADKVIHPVAVVVQGQFAAESGEDHEEEKGDYDKSGRQTEGFASSIVPTLEEKTIYERRPSATHANGQPLFDLIEEQEQGESAEDHGPSEATVPDKVKEHDTIVDGRKEATKRGVPRIQGERGDGELYGAPANAVDNDDAPPNKDTERRDGEDAEQHAAIAARKTLRKHLNAQVGLSPWAMPTPTPKVNPNRFHDPLDDGFWKDMWVAVAVHNTEIFRKVFKCIPDDLVTTWASYKAFANHAEKFNKMPEEVAAPGHEEPVKVVHDGPGTHGAGGGGSGGGAVGQGKEGMVGELERVDSEAPTSPKRVRSLRDATSENDVLDDGGGERMASGPNEAWAQWEKDEMEKLLGEVRGSLGE